MPQYPPPRRLRADNIQCVLSRSIADGLVRALVPLRRKSGPWMDRDPQDHEAWWQAVLNDPRARRSRQERLPENHRDACLRLDRCEAERLTVSCANCRASAVYTIADLISSFGRDQNMLTLPDYLLPCPSKRYRREGACELRATLGGYPERVRSVKSALQPGPATIAARG